MVISVREAWIVLNAPTVVQYVVSISGRSYSTDLADVFDILAKCFISIFFFFFLFFLSFFFLLFIMNLKCNYCTDSQIRSQHFNASTSSCRNGYRRN